MVRATMHKMYVIVVCPLLKQLEKLTGVHFSVQDELPKNHLQYKIRLQTFENKIHTAPLSMSR